MSSEQSNAELRERVARAIQAAEAYEFAWGDYLRFADAVLAALGLDDLDAAVERMAASRMWGADSPMDQETREAFRADLLAALTPPEDERPT